MNKSTKTWIENRRVNKYWFWKLTEAIVLVAVQIKFLFGNEHIYIVNLPIRLFVLNFYKLSVMKIQISPIYLNSILMYKTDFSSSSNYAWYGINDPFLFLFVSIFSPRRDNKLLLPYQIFPRVMWHQKSNFQNIGRIFFCFTYNPNIQIPKSYS